MTPGFELFALDPTHTGYFRQPQELESVLSKLFGKKEFDVEVYTRQMHRIPADMGACS